MRCKAAFRLMEILSVGSHQSLLRIPTQWDMRFTCLNLAVFFFFFFDIFSP